MNDKIVVIKDMSAGNESVGEMWQETKIFDKNDTLDDVLKWAMSEYSYENNHPTTKRITITRSHE